MINVLFLIPTLAHGGAERVLVNLVNNMDPSRYKITVETLFDVGVNKQYLKSHIRYISFCKWVFRGNSKLIAMIPPKILYKLIVRERYDVVVSYLEGPTARIISGCPFRDSKKICWIHIELQKPISKKWLKTYHEFDKIVCVSESVKREFLQMAAEPFDNVEVLYNTNETDIIRERSKEDVNDFDVDPSFVNICSVAKLVPSKGYDRLLRVHNRLIKEGLKHRIYVIGKGENRKELEKSIREYNLEDTFKIIGFKENPYKYMAQCDLYICSSRKEGFSTAVTEALILGLPVVSTRCSGAEELLGRKDEYGIVVDNSEEGIYEGLKRMIESEELRRNYKLKSEERGRSFCKERTVLEVENMMECLIKEQ